MRAAPRAAPHRLRELRPPALRGLERGAASPTPPRWALAAPGREAAQPDPRPPPRPGRWREARPGLRGRQSRRRGGHGRGGYKRGRGDRTPSGQGDGGGSESSYRGEHGTAGAARRESAGAGGPRPRLCRVAERLPPGRRRHSSRFPGRLLAALAPPLELVYIGGWRPRSAEGDGQAPGRSTGPAGKGSAGLGALSHLGGLRGVRLALSLLRSACGGAGIRAVSRQTSSSRVCQGTGRPVRACRRLTLLLRSRQIRQHEPASDRAVPLPGAGLGRSQGRSRAGRALAALEVVAQQGLP